MQGVWCLMVLWVLCAGVESQNRSQNRVQQSNQQVKSNKRPPFKTWNSQMYPIWRGGEDEQKDCWKGGQVTFDLINDAPTLTGAKVTFSIQLNFPHNQTVLPDGQVVWNRNSTENGTWVSSGEPVYPDEAVEGSSCTFPDGRPFPSGAEKRHSKFVYVWQTWGKYWQVVDGPSSNLTVETDGIPLGSYTMQLVIYHYRGRQKFIPIGSVSSQFSITDQIPVSVSVSQLLDLDQEDQRFIQNRAVSFSVAVHDPSHYLQDADISFTWDFGDQSGTLITRNTAVTHTYVSPGVFRPKVILQAAIPLSPCGSTTPVVTTIQSVSTTVVPPEPTSVADATTGAGQTVVPSGTAAPAPTNTTLTEAASGVVITIATPVAENNLEVESATLPESESVTAAAGEALTVAVVAEEVEAETETAGEAVTVSGEEEGEAVTEEAGEGEAVTVPIPQEGESVTEGTSEAVAGEEEGAVTVAETITIQEGVTSIAENTVEEIVVEGSPSLQPTEVVTELAAATEVQVAPTTGGQEVVVLAKRQAPEGPLVGCLLYRYGTFATDLDIVQGIESVQIVNVAPINAAEGGLENAVDLTIACQGSLPSEVCTMISDPDCITPQQTVCSPVEPSSDCQLVLRQIFNDTGIYCVNVSLTNDVSLAVASTQISISSGVQSSSLNAFAIMVGVLLAVFAVGTVAYTYRRQKTYTALKTENASTSNWFPDRLSLRLFFQNALGRSLSGESSPLLSGNLV